MSKLPRLHPRIGSSIPFSATIKRRLGAPKTPSIEAVADAFPQYVDTDMNLEPVNREHTLQSSFHIDRTYFMTVFTPHHRRVHKLFTWWYNRILSSGDLPAVFTPFDTHQSMAHYQFDAVEQTYKDGGSVPQPYTVNQLDGAFTDSYAILYNYLPNNGQIDDLTLRAFEHIVATTKRLHDGGFVHSLIPQNVHVAVPSGEPYLIDPLGHTLDSEQATLIGQAYDIAKLIAWFTPEIGTLPAINEITNHYPDLYLIATYHVAPAIQITTPNLDHWVVRQLQSSIEEYIDEDTVKTYQDHLEAMEEQPEIDVEQILADLETSSDDQYLGEYKY